MSLRTADFHYDLPPELIADRPLERRSDSRMMVIDRAKGTIEHKRFTDFESYLRPDDLVMLNNTRVMQYLEREFNTPAEERERWSRHWISEGFDALEALLAENPSTGQFCEGDDPSLADVCLVPQVYNARRWGMDMADYPTIARIADECAKLPAFERARPENQPDAPKS